MRQHLWLWRRLLPLLRPHWQLRLWRRPLLLLQSLLAQ